MKNKDFIANSMTEFIALVQKIVSSEQICWFRGHEDVRFALVPSLYRVSELERCHHSEMEVCSLNIDRKTRPYKFKFNRKLVFDRFKREGLAFVTQQPRNDFEWLVLMQHYGGKTQLLDWTCNPLISLYFALLNIKPYSGLNEKLEGQAMSKFITDCVGNSRYINSYDFSSDFDRSDFSVVYIINPLKINRKNRIPKDSEIVTSDLRFQTELDNIINLGPQKITSSYPICVEAPKFDPRACNQGSGFTLHSYYVDGLDWFTNTQDHIYKIFIPHEKGVEMKKDLRKIYGFTHSFVFQDLSSAVKDAYEDSGRNGVIHYSRRSRHK